MHSCKTTQRLINLMTYAPGIHVNEIKELFEKINTNQFNLFIKKVLKSNDSTLFDQFTYYLILFKDLPCIHELMKSQDVAIEVLEHIVVFAYTRACMNRQPEDEALDAVLIFLNQEQYLDLLLRSEIVAKDRLLCYYIITKLDRQHIDEFFNNHSDIIAFLDGFMRLPEDTIRMILDKNPDLFGYISMFLRTMNSNTAEEFTRKFRVGIQEMESIKSIVTKINNSYDLEHERALPLSERDKKRLGDIIRQLKRFNNIFVNVHTLAIEGVILDETEEALIDEIMTNPMFKDVLKRYSRKQL